MARSRLLSVSTGLTFLCRWGGSCFIKQEYGYGTYFKGKDRRETELFLRHICSRRATHRILTHMDIHLFYKTRVVIDGEVISVSHLDLNAPGQGLDANLPPPRQGEAMLQYQRTGKGIEEGIMPLATATQLICASHKPERLTDVGQ